MTDEEVRKLGYEPTSKGWMPLPTGNRESRGGPAAKWPPEAIGQGRLTEEPEPPKRRAKREARPKRERGS
jgi:hypothetical protein